MLYVFLILSYFSKMKKKNYSLSNMVRYWLFSRKKKKIRVGERTWIAGVRISTLGRFPVTAQFYIEIIHHQNQL